MLNTINRLNVIRPYLLELRAIARSVEEWRAQDGGLTEAAVDALAFASTCERHLKVLALHGWRAEIADEVGLYYDAMLYSKTGVESDIWGAGHRACLALNRYIERRAQ